MLIHPLVVHFPIALWLVAALFDVLAWRRSEPVYRQAAYWLVGIGLLGAAASITFGWVDLLALEKQGVGKGLLIRHQTHSVIAYVATALYLGNFLWRWRSQNRLPAGLLVLSLVGAVLMGITAFLGGAMRDVM